jgi:hypothetical protein
VSSDTPRAASLSSIALALTTIGAATVYSIWGYASLLLFLAAAVLCLVIVLMWASLQHMGEGDEMSFEEALSFAAPSATEEQKRAVLRTLKDLEYELHVGKISREDFDEVSKEVRKKAKFLIAQQDEDLEERLKKAEARIVKFKKTLKNQEHHARRSSRRESNEPSDGGSAEKSNDNTQPLKEEEVE